LRRSTPSGASIGLLAASGTARLRPRRPAKRQSLVEQLPDQHGSRRNATAIGNAPLLLNSLELSWLEPKNLPDQTRPENFPLERDPRGSRPSIKLL
jgi:hypothetical protein